MAEATLLKESDDDVTGTHLFLRKSLWFIYLSFKLLFEKYPFRKEPKAKLRNIAVLNFPPDLVLFST